jgi:hypothetical protein
MTADPSYKIDIYLTILEHNSFVNKSKSICGTGTVTFQSITISYRPFLS